MSEDGIKTITSSSALSTDDDWTNVTGTDFGADPTKKRLLDVNVVTGSATAPGGGGVSSGLTTDVTISDASWTALPPTSLANRAGFSVQNQTAFEIKINFGTPAGYVGVIVAAGGERFYDANDSAVIYARAEAGAGVALSGILVEELVP